MQRCSANQARTCDCLTGRQPSRLVRPLLSRMRLAYTLLRLLKVPGKPVKAGLLDMSSPLMMLQTAYNAIRRAIQVMPDALWDISSWTHAQHCNKAIHATSISGTL